MDALGDPVHVQTQLLVDTVTSHLAEIVAFRIEEELVDKRACRLQVRCFTGAKLAVDRFCLCQLAQPIQVVSSLLRKLTMTVRIIG